jgi:hypothetical protein
MTFVTRSDAMRKYRSEIEAREWAKDQGLYYGCSVFGGMWYVGTRAQLTKIGVWNIRS